MDHIILAILAALSLIYSDLPNTEGPPAPCPGPEAVEARVECPQATGSPARGNAPASTPVHAPIGDAGRSQQ
jgi:hypothetical protein